jgi:S1-C subfamily serine protease
VEAAELDIKAAVSGVQPAKLDVEAASSHLQSAEPDAEPASFNFVPAVHNVLPAKSKVLPAAVSLGAGAPLFLVELASFDHAERQMSPVIHRWCLALFLLGAVLPHYASGQSNPGRANLGALSHSLQAVAARVTPAVVQIQVAAYGPVDAGATGTRALIGTQRSTGSGVILSADGFVVTNAHVVDGGRRFVVVLPRPAATGSPGRSVVPPVSQEVSASLVGIDRETDLAVLKLNLTNLPFVRLEDADSVAPGQVVLAFGSPF